MRKIEQMPTWKYLPFALILLGMYALSKYYLPASFSDIVESACVGTCIGKFVRYLWLQEKI